MLSQAFVKTQRITCFYDPTNKHLFVPTSSGKLADIVTSKLIKAIGSIKATTIYCDGIKQSLSSKLQNYLVDEDSIEGIGDFLVDGSCKLKAEGGKTLAVKGNDIVESKDAILEALDQGAMVTELALTTESVYFRIGHDFVLRGVSFLTDSGEEEPDFECEEDKFRTIAGVHVLLLSDVVNKLKTLFEYKEPEQDEDIPVHPSSGNVFADLGRPDAEEALARVRVEGGGSGCTVVPRILYRRPARAVPRRRRERTHGPGVAQHELLREAGAEEATARVEGPHPRREEH